MNKLINVFHWRNVNKMLGCYTAEQEDENDDDLNEWEYMRKLYEKR